MLTKKLSDERVFNFGLDLDELKCEQKSVSAADFAKQVSSIQEVKDII